MKNDIKDLELKIEEYIKPVLPDNVADLRIQLGSVKTLKDQLEARKELITRPMREALQSARDLFRPLEEKLQDIDWNIRRALLHIKEIQETEQKKLAKKVEQGKISLEDSMALIIPEPKGLFREVQKLKIISESSIPKRYWIIDEVKLRSDLLSGRKVSGAILIKEKTVVSR